MKNKKILLWMLVFLISLVGVIAIDTDNVTIWYDMSHITTNVLDLAEHYNGTAQNGVVLTSDATSKYAYFDNVDDYISTVADVTIGATFSLSVWFNTSTADGTIIGHRPDGDNRHCILNIGGDGTLYFNTYNGGTGGCGTPNYATSMTDGAWKHVVVTQDGTDNKIYVNGINVLNTTMICSNSDTEPLEIGSYNTGTGSTFGVGRITGVGIFNDILNSTEITSMYAEGRSYNPYVPLGEDSINLSSPLPVDDSLFNSLPIFFNVSGNFSYETNCSLYINDSVNQTNNYLSGTNVNVSFNVSFFSDGGWNYIIGCVDNTTEENTSVNVFTVDTLDPVIVDNFLNLSIYYEDNLTAQFNFSDNILLHSVNITVDGSVVFNVTGISNASYQYNLSQDPTVFGVGEHFLNVRVADGHTAKVLKDASAWNPVEGAILKYQLVSPYPDVMMKMYLKSRSNSDSWEYKEFKNRFCEVLHPAIPKSTQVFVFESDTFIDIVGDGISYGGEWLIVGDHWKDWVLKDEPNARVSIERVNDFKVEVTITNISRPELLEFESTGDLNIVNVNYTFFVVNMSESFEGFVLAGFDTSFFLNVDFGNLTFNLTGFTPAALLEWNNSNYSTVLDSFSSLNANFSKVLSVPLWDGSILVNHSWHFNFTNLTDGFLSTGIQVQNVTRVELAPCNSSIVFPVLNMSYFDEVNDVPLNVTNAYVLNISDGTYFYDQTGSFTGNESNSFCTNINPDNASYDWSLFGTFTLSSEGFVTRIRTISEGYPLVLSNDPVTNLSLYLIGINDSSTITYNWQTTEFQPITGTMLIYECEDDGEKVLVESIPIIGGQAVGNIQLLISAYSYEVIIDGVLYTDASWTTCHVESTTERTFYVDLGVVNALPVIGLFLVDCDLVNVSENVVRMSWSSNSEDSGDIEACIVAKRRTVKGLVEIFRNCTNASSGSFTNSIPDTGNAYVVTGEIFQDGVKGFCRNSVVFFDRSVASSLFGLSGLFGIVLLLLGMILLYAGQGEIQLVAAGVALVASWVLGLLSFPWEIISAVIAFLIIIILVGRYTKKQRVD